MCERGLGLEGVDYRVIIEWVRVCQGGRVGIEMI